VNRPHPDKLERVPPGSDDHWLTRPATIRWLWILFGVVLAGTVALQWVIPVKGKFVLDGTFAFGAWFGFGACVAMVLAAKVLGWVLKRPENYYGDRLEDLSGSTVPPSIPDADEGRREDA
jgi:hypothetical protein